MMVNNLQAPVNVDDPQVLKNYLDSLSATLINMSKAVDEVSTVTSKVAEVLAPDVSVDPAFIDFVDETQKLEAEIKEAVRDNLETIEKQSTELSYVIEQFGTNYQNNEAASWYGLTVGAGNIMTGFTIGALDKDTTSYGNEDSVFGIQSDRFYIGRAATTNAERNYLSNKDQDFLTLYDASNNAIPAFGIDWNSDNNRYDIFFNGVVSFNNVDTGYTDGTGNTIIDGGSIRTNSISANTFMAGYNSETVWKGGGLVSNNFNGNSYGSIGSPTRGFRLSSDASGTYADPNIYGSYIRGGTIYGSTLLGVDGEFSGELTLSKLGNSDLTIKNNAGQYIPAVSFDSVSLEALDGIGGTGTGPYSPVFTGPQIRTHSSFILSGTVYLTAFDGANSNPGSATLYLQYSVNNGSTWYTLQSFYNNGSTGESEKDRVFSRAVSSVSGSGNIKFRLYGVSTYGFTAEMNNAALMISNLG